MGGFSEQLRAPDEEERNRRSVADKVVDAGAAESFLAEAKKHLSPEDWERVHRSVAEAQSRHARPMPPGAWDRSVAFGVAAVMIPLLWYIVCVVANSPSAARMLLAAPVLGVPAGVILGVITLTKQKGGRHHRLGTVLGWVAIALGLLPIAGFILLAISAMTMIGSPGGPP